MNYAEAWKEKIESIAFDDAKAAQNVAEATTIKAAHEKQTEEKTITYEGSGRHQGLFPRGHIEYKNGVPDLFSYENDLFEVATSTFETTSGDFLKYQITRAEGGQIDTIKFEDSNAQEYFDGITNSFLHSKQKAISGHFTPEEISAYKDQVLKWCDNLAERDIKVKVQKVAINTTKGNVSINRVIIGQTDGTPEQMFAVEEKALETFITCEAILEDAPCREFTIFDTSVPLNSNFDEIFGTYLTSVNETENPSGRTMFLTPSFIDTRDNQEKRISLPRTLDKVAHEIGHLNEPNHELSTRVQKEALAQFIEFGGDYMAINRRLRKGRNFTDKISADMVAEAFSPTCGDEVKHIHYDVAAMFSCWVYQNLGQENFAKWYKSQSRNEISFADNLDAFTSSREWTWESPEEFVNDFLKKVNQETTPRDN